MKSISKLDGVTCIDLQDLFHAADQMLDAAHVLIGIQNPIMDANLMTVELQFKTLLNNPLLVTGMAILATLEKFRVDYAYEQNAIQLLLQDITESIDCSGVKPTEFWMQSDLAAIDKAKELSINISPEYSMADLRYKIYCAINEVI